MLLCIPIGMNPHRLLFTAPYLLEEPRAATAAIEAAIRACPTPTYLGEYPFPTYAQRAALQDLIDNPYLTHREAIWLELWSTQFDTATAAELLTQLPRVISYRQALGIAPVPQKGGLFFPERLTPPQP